jgi:hypothetical protein
MVKYRVTDPDHKKFVRDMKAAKLKITHYRGRNFWQGPAVMVDELSDAMRATTVACQWDSMGKGYVVYPKKNAPVEEVPHD